MPGMILDSQKKGGDNDHDKEEYTASRKPPSAITVKIESRSPANKDEQEAEDSCSLKPSRQLCQFAEQNPLSYSNSCWLKNPQGKVQYQGNHTL